MTQEFMLIGLFSLVGISFLTTLLMGGFKSRFENMERGIARANRSVALIAMTYDTAKLKENSHD